MSTPPKDLRKFLLVKELSGGQNSVTNILRTGTIKDTLRQMVVGHSTKFIISFQENMEELIFLKT